MTKWVLDLVNVLTFWSYCKALHTHFLKLSTIKGIRNCCSVDINLSFHITTQIGTQSGNSGYSAIKESILHWVREQQIGWSVSIRSLKVFALVMLHSMYSLMNFFFFFLALLWHC